MINVRGALTDVVKEKSPKKVSFPKDAFWVQGKYLCNCHTRGMLRYYI